MLKLSLRRSNVIVDFNGAVVSNAKIAYKHASCTHVNELNCMYTELSVLKHVVILLHTLMSR